MDFAKFQLIKKEYDDFYSGILKSGKLPLWDTGAGFWNAAAEHEVYEAFKQLRLQRFNNFLDLGSGDGKVVLIASLFGVKAHGIEIDKTLVMKAVDVQKKLRLNATFTNGNFLEHDISKYDVLFVNPDKPMQRGLEDKLLREMKGKLIHYGHHFHPVSLKAEKVLRINDNLVTLYGR